MKVNILFKYASIFLLLFTSSIVIAQDNQKIIIKGILSIGEGAISDEFKLLNPKVWPDGRFRVEIVGDASFIDGLKDYEISLYKQDRVDLRSVNPGPLQSESTINFYFNNVKLKDSVKIFSAHRAWLDEFIQESSALRSAIQAQGTDFILVNESKLLALLKTQKVNNRIAGNKKDAGISFFIDDYGNEVNTKGLCIRFFTPYTRYGSGIVNWQISNPRQYMTLKDENTSSSLASKLRCPHKAGFSTDYYIDGIYSVLWQNPFRALKVPDHCTVTRIKTGFNSCCNAAMSALYGKTRFINPRSIEFPDWPDNVRVCSLNER